MFNDDINTLFQRVIWIDTILDAFCIGLDGCDWCFQVMGNVLYHFILDMRLMLQFFVHFNQSICHLTNFISSVNLQFCFFIISQLFNIISNLIQWMNHCCNPDHQNDKQSTYNHKRQVDHTVKQSIAIFVAIIVIQQRNAQILLIDWLKRIHDMYIISLINTFIAC